MVVSDACELFFDTLASSRKCANLQANPHVAFVLGWDDAQTVQLEGVADEPTGDELERLKALYFARFPDGRDREAAGGVAYFRVRPRLGEVQRFPWRGAPHGRDPTDIRHLRISPYSSPPGEAAY